MRDERGRIISGSASLNPTGLKPDGTSGKLSIRETIRGYLEGNPAEMQKVINHFVEKNPEFMWRMMEIAPPQGQVHMNPDGSQIDTNAIALLELTQKLNGLYNRPGLTSNGTPPSLVGDEAPAQDIERPAV